MQRTVVLLIAACGARTPTSTGASRDAAHDAPVVMRDAPADVPSEGARPAPCDLDRPFMAPVPVTELNTPEHEGGLRLSADGLTAYFTRYDRTTWGDLYTATRSDTTDPFGSFRALVTLNTADDEGGPAVTSDGLTIYFSRFINNTGAYDIWVSRRPNMLVGFPPPVRANLPPQSMSPYLATDGVLYFSTRPQIDIARSERTGSAFGPIDIVLSSSDNELSPVVTADERTLYYSLGGSMDPNGVEIMAATRPSASAPFSSGKPVSELDGPKNEGPSYVSPDGCTLYFTSDRAGSLDVYVAQKPK